MARQLPWFCAAVFAGFPIAATAQSPSGATPITKYDGTYAFMSANKVDKTYFVFGSSRIGQCWETRNVGPLVISNGHARYYSSRKDQTDNEGIVDLRGELMMRLAATPAAKATRDPPAVITTGQIDGNGTARARMMGDWCSYDVVWQKISSSSGSPRFDGTYALVSVKQVGEDNSGLGTSRTGQCGNRKPKSLIVTNGQAWLPVFEGTVGSGGDLAMREGPSGYERIINGRIEANGTVRAREIGRGCAYDFVWQKVNE